jgi:uncharacterized protein involved in exopolysaccharide biosynthesis
MQVRQIVAAALLAASAIGAMAQEIDRSETLQAKNLAAQQEAAASRSSESVRAETRNLQAAGQLSTVGERADAPVVPAAPAAPAVGLTRAQVKAELAQWRLTHKQEFGERG